jgi:hypothetical protein
MGEMFVGSAALATILTARFPRWEKRSWNVCDNLPILKQLFLAALPTTAIRTNHPMGVRGMVARIYSEHDADSHPG